MKLAAKNQYVPFKFQKKLAYTAHFPTFYLPSNLKTSRSDFALDRHLQSALGNAKRENGRERKGREAAHGAGPSRGPRTVRQFPSLLFTQNRSRIHVGRSGTSSPIVSPRSRPKKPSSNLLKKQITFPTIFLKPLSTLPKLIFKVPSTIPNCVPGHFPSFISRFARESPSKSL